MAVLLSRAAFAVAMAIFVTNLQELWSFTTSRYHQLDASRPGQYYGGGLIVDGDSTAVSKPSPRSSSTAAPATSAASSSSSSSSPSSSSSFPLNALFEAAAKAALPTKPADDGSGSGSSTASGGHDAFRFEWGRWVDDGRMEELMSQVNKIKIMKGGRVYDRLLAIEPQGQSKSTSFMAGSMEKAAVAADDEAYGTMNDDDDDDEGGARPHVVPDPEQGSQIGRGRSISISSSAVVSDAVFKKENGARRFRVSGGSHWDCILHVLPKGTEWTGRWPTGSWIVIRTLTGVAEIAMLRGPDRDGIVSKVTSVALKGGGDGSLGGGKEGGGENCVKYVGGAQRSYSGKSGKTLLLEVVLRPPVGTANMDGDGQSSFDIEPLPPEDVLMDGINDAPESIKAPMKESPPAQKKIQMPEAPTKQSQKLRRDEAALSSNRDERLSRKKFRNEKRSDVVEPTRSERRRPRIQEERSNEVEPLRIDRRRSIRRDDFDLYDEFVDGYDDTLESSNMVDSDGVYYDDFEVEYDNLGNEYDDENALDEFDNDFEDDRTLGEKLGLSFEKVGGLDDQLDAIVRRVLASRANPEAARRLGVNHVRGILLSGPPGCGKTLLARELSEMLGAREPKIVNGPEILDKFIGEAEKNVRALFEPAEREFEELGDESALHVIVLDELDAIARRRGSVSGDTTGVKDSVVNQLLAKIDGVKEANNVLVVGLTNRPELLDPALTRPGRLEVHLKVELPDLKGRRDILRIHTREMKSQGGLHPDARALIEDISTKRGLPARTEFFTGAELAGLVRSAASFALARTVEAEMEYEDGGLEEATVKVFDLEQALKEVKPALGKQDEVLEARFPYGVSPSSLAMQRVMRDLQRFTSTPGLLSKQRLSAEDDIRNEKLKAGSTLQSLLLVGDGYKGGTGATSLACWAASEASRKGEANYVRLVTALDILAAGGGGDEAARATALVERFAEASSMPNSLLVFDDIDQICSGTGPGGYSGLMLSTLRALLRSPSAGAGVVALATDPSSELIERKVSTTSDSKSLSVIAATSRTDAVCSVLHKLFDETLVVPELADLESIQRLLTDSIEKMGPVSDQITDATLTSMAELMINRLETVGTKTALRLLERAIAMSYRASKKQNIPDNDQNSFLERSMTKIIDDYVRDQEAAGLISCKVKD